MCSDQLAICAENLGKCYTLYQRPQDRLKHTLTWRFGRHYGTPFWALKDVSFEVRRGETFGIIGRNGSGKSTLLQILAGILQPSTGQVKVQGRVAALLELGSGFNPEYTGRENIFLNGSILGISPQQMSKQLDQIIAFADIGPFIDQPVKLYSSGMFVRLAFAVAAGVDADVLIIDEALAVGDIFFRQKCYQRLDALRQQGVSIILVSHAMNEVEQFCERALLLDGGTPQFLGSAVEAVKRYYLFDQLSRPARSSEAPEAASQPAAAVDLEDDAWFPPSEAWLDISRQVQVSNGWASLTAMALCDSAGRPCAAFEQGETAYFFFEVLLHRDIEVPVGGVELINEKGIIVHGKNSLLYGTAVPRQVQAGERLRFRQQISLALACGEYTFNVGTAALSNRHYERRGALTNSELDAGITVMSILPQAGQFAVIFRRTPQPTQLLHFGAVNLPGSMQVSLAPKGEDHA